MDNKIIEFEKQPIIKTTNNSELKIFSNHGTLIAEIEGRSEIIIPFSDNGNVEEIISIVAYKQLTDNLYQLYSRTFYYNNEILCEGELSAENIPYLLIINNKHIKLFDSYTQFQKFENTILL